MLKIVQGDLLEADVDVIVNAANGDLAHGGGIAAAIAQAAGSDLMIESNRKGLVPTGGAVATTAGKLPFRAVVHAVGPVWGGGAFQERELLRSAYRSGLQVVSYLAQAYGERWSVAFPALSCGIYDYPVRLAAPVAVDALLTADFRGVGDIFLYVLEPDDAAIFQAALDAKRPAGQS